uniref:Uncharacterized protein n=1 Tax=Arundo donax TaxID=35708 RepID=A0A0A9C540_ARUDO
MPTCKIGSISCWISSWTCHVVSCYFICTLGS